MKTSITVSSECYKIINVTSVTNLIDGKVYIGDPPDGSQLVDIGINTLNNTADYLQTGVLNVNVFMRSYKKGRPNLLKFNEVVQELMNLLEDANSGRYFFQVEDNKGPFKDQNRQGMYFYNIRVKFQTFKN